MRDLQLTDGIWLDIEETETLPLEKGDLTMIAEFWLGAHRWVKSEANRKAYASTDPVFLERMDRRYALAERIVKALDA